MMGSTFPVRGLAPDVVKKLDSAAEAEGCSRNAYIVQVLTEHARRVRPVVTEASLREAAALAADLGDEDLLRAAWS